MRAVIINSQQSNTFHLSACLQQVGHATTIASGYPYKWSHGVPFNHCSAQTNLASRLIMEHLYQHHQKCSEKYVVLASQPTFFAQHVHASKIGCQAACTANADDHVRTAAMLPMNANNESIRFAKQGNKNDFHSKLITFI